MKSHRNHTKSVLAQKRRIASEENILKAGVFWAQVVDNRVPTIPIITTSAV